MTNQGYRLTGLGTAIIGIWMMALVVLNRTQWFDLIPACASLIFIAGWAVQSRMFSKLPPDMQIQIGYAIREDFDLGPQGELIEKQEDF